MAKKKKNANYVTDKTIAKAQEAEAAEQKEKQLKTAGIIAITIVACIAVIGIFIGLLFAFGAFEYTPEATWHASLTMVDGTNIHIELYGEDAPETVDHFMKMCKLGAYNGEFFESLINGALYIGSEHDENGGGVKGEFKSNGVDNKIAMKAGALCMGRGEHPDSGYEQIFFLTEDRPDLEGDYAVFGMVTNMEDLMAVIRNCTFDNNGKLISGPSIKSFSFHEAHH